LRPGNSFTDKIDSLNATRAEVGWAWARVLLFTTAGLETGFVNGSASYVARSGGSPALTLSDNNTFHVGCTVGGGLDYALTDKVSVGVEYRYFDLGKQTYNLGAVTGTAAAGALTSEAGRRSSPDNQIVSWHKHWTGHRVRDAKIGAGYQIATVRIFHLFTPNRSSQTARFVFASPTRSAAGRLLLTVVVLRGAENLLRRTAGPYNGSHSPVAPPPRGGRLISI
jgi:hypothetical protein